MGGAVIVEAAEIIPDDVIALVEIDTMQDFEEKYTPEQIEELMKPFKEDFKKGTNSFVKSMFVKGTDPKFMDEIAGTMSGASAKVGISALEEVGKTK